MTFTYPAVFTPHKEDKGFHVSFPDLECCEADAADLEDALDAAREAAYTWLQVEMEEEEGYFPEQSHPEDISLPEGAFVRNIMVRVKLLPDND
ncbi:MAG: type II toxin-antitoxin system HicB family antitoxin [Clostridiales bacterium]|nr:type II toxin-antitoxin system HicB family antitoxin [Clostridiales bacterium]MCD8370881.1 type II toxin-antitoxin system HicB family antitoxin [Clostridiales bacterium]